MRNVPKPFFQQHLPEKTETPKHDTSSTGLDRGNLELSFWSWNSSERVFKAKFCSRHTTKGGEPPAVNVSVSHYSQTLPLDPRAYKGLKCECVCVRVLGGRGDGHLTERAPVALSLGLHCVHTGVQRIIFVKYALINSLDKSVLAS